MNDPAREPSKELRSDALGMWDLVFFVVAAAAPLAVMSGVAPLAIQFGGIGAPGGYLLGGIAMFVFAVGFTAMTRYVPNPGAFYAYISEGLGRTVGGGAAFVALASYIPIAVGFVPAIGVFAQQSAESVFGLHVPWGVWAAIGGAIVAILGYLNVTLSAKVLGTILVLEVLVLLVFTVPVVVQGGAEGLSLDGFSPGNIFAPGVGGLFVLSFGAFLGFESTAIYRGETRDGTRAVPRATYIAVGFLAVFYSLVVWAVIMSFGESKAVETADSDPADMFFVAMTQWVGKPVSDAMHLLLVTSALASVLAVHNASARYLHALARDRVLPRVLARTDPRTHSPANASLLVTALTVLGVGGFQLFGADPYLQTFLWLNGIGIAGIIGLQVLCSIAIIVFFARDSHGVGIVRRLVAPTAAALALTAALYLIVENFSVLTGAGTATNTVLLLVVPVAFLVGAAATRRARRVRHEPQPTLSLDNRLAPAPGRTEGA
ncbi:APC family permease [Embleya sp. NPDC005971]|uniref:APC family permease n=1 Tax=Embleya sp. NPDC005971 TaxID=3156724 RepID=UPI00340D96D7